MTPEEKLNAVNEYLERVQTRIVELIADCTKSDPVKEKAAMGKINAVNKILFE